MLEIKIEGDLLTINGMRELLQDARSILGLDWAKECGIILGQEIEATLKQDPTYVQNGEHFEPVYSNKSE